MPHLWKPTFVTHEGGITSVDIHPDRTRFATAGVDGKVMIWQTAPLVDASYDEKEYEPLLSVLPNHTSAVNIVRWSPDGKLLASAGDDKAVILWEYRAGPATAIAIPSNDTFVPSENWQPKAVMRDGHAGDILDLCWSPDGKYIATASVDNKVCIWDVSTQRVIKSMEKHTGIVKGVAWDPLGRYLSSIGDDKSLVMWRTSDWVPETEIKSPFRKAPTNVMYKRLTWSPDGQVLVASGAVKNGKDIATIIGRKDWNTDKEFVGHALPVASARFSPCFYLDDAKKGIRMVCALGGQDSNVSIWMTDRPRALVALTKMFGQIVTDLSWSSDGAVLLVSSLDGTLGVVRFEENEIGTRLSQTDANSHMVGLHGDVYTAASGNALIEDPSLLDLAGSRSAHATAATTATAKPFAAPSPSQPRPTLPSAPFDATVKPTTRIVQTVGNANVVSIETGAGAVEQIVTATKSGRKRIQPLSLNPTVEQSPSMPAPASMLMPPPAPVTPAGTAAAALGSPITPSALSIPPRMEAFPALAGSESAVFVNKKRKRDEEAALGLASDRDQSADDSDDDEESRRRSRKRRRLDYDSDSDLSDADDALSRMDRVNPLGYGAVRAGAPSGGLRRQMVPAILVRPPNVTAAGSRFVREIKISQTDTLPFALTPELIADIAAAAASSSSSLSNNRPSALAVEVTHAEETLTGNVSFVSCLADSTILWKDRLKTQICVAAVSTHFVAVGSISGELQLYSIAGRRLMTGIVLGSPVCLLEFSTNSPHLAAICSDGTFFVWNVNLMIQEVSGSVAAAILTSKSEIQQLKLWSDAIVIVMKNGESFSFNPHLKCWTRIYDQLSFVASNFWSPNRATSTPGHLHTLFTEVATRSKLHLAQVASTNEQSRQMETIAHLESNLSAAEQLGSAEEYRTWFKAYIRQLTELTSIARLEEVFSDLLGPSHATESTLTWSSHICGIPKRELLHDALPLIASNIRLQRMTSKYRESAELLAKRN